MIWFPERDPTGCCNAELGPVGLDFEKLNRIRYGYPNCVLLLSQLFKPLMAPLDLGRDVEQPFDCLIVKNRQAMQSMGGRWIGH